MKSQGFCAGSGQQGTGRGSKGWLDRAGCKLGGITNTAWLQWEMVGMKDVIHSLTQNITTKY